MKLINYLPHLERLKDSNSKPHAKKTMLDDYYASKSKIKRMQNVAAILEKCRNQMMWNDLHHMYQALVFILKCFFLGPSYLYRKKCHFLLRLNESTNHSFPLVSLCLLLMSPNAFRKLQMSILTHLMSNMDDQSKTDFNILIRYYGGGAK